MNPTTEKQDAILSDTIDILKTRIPVPFSEIRLDSVVVGVFFTSVKLRSGYEGICFTPVDLIPDAVCCSTATSTMPNCGKIQGVMVEDMLTHLSTPTPLVRAVIVSVVNALSVLKSHG